MGLLKDICTGDAHVVVNALCWPFVLVANFLFIYVLPCLGVVTSSVLCYPLRLIFPCFYGQYVDKKFPPKATSIVDVTKASMLDDENEFKLCRSNAEIERKIEWVRAKEVCGGGEDANLYGEDGIKPQDVLQGALGDCWLLASMAAMAEHEEAIMNLFSNVHSSLRGRYVVHLYDGGNKRWEKVVVDDYIPVHQGTKKPYFTAPVGNELWVFLLEKAFAKFCGGYANLDGGMAAWAWHTMTGDNVFSLRNKPSGGRNVWHRSVYRFTEWTEKERRRDAVHGEDTFERFDDQRVTQVLRKYSHIKSVMACAAHDHALVEGTAFHAYSLLHVEHLLQKRKYIVKLRNPWGSGEWNGAWSDSSPEWDRNPLLKRLLRHDNDTKDGVFWMPMKDFLRIFDRIDVCDRSAHRDLRFKARESECCGPPKGICLGTGWYWCLCGGCRTIYCGHRSKSDIAEPQCCSCGSKGETWVEDSDAYHRAAGHRNSHM